MTDIFPFLKSLISASGLSAYEGPVARLIEERWKPLVDEISTSRLGSLHALKRGTGKGKRPSVMIATHMDAIGLIVTRIEDGFLHVDEIGGIDPRILPGTPVVVHGKRDLPGVAVMPPLKTLPEGDRGNAIDLPHILVDVGLLPSSVNSLVRIGDTVSFDTQPVELAGETISGHSLDNRISIAALTVCLEDLQARSHAWDVWAVATTQEEETFGGAATSAFHLQPDLAVVIDVTFAKGPGANDWQAFGMGKGPTLGWGANLHPFLFERFKELADKLEIPVSATKSYTSTLVGIAPPVDRYDFGRVLQSTKPKFLVHGERDELISLKSIREFYARLQEPKELVEIDRANHLFDGQAGEVGDALEELLSDFSCKTL